MKKLSLLSVLSLIFIITFGSFGSEASAEAGWQNIGSYKFEAVVRITSKDGGNLKVCVNNNSEKIKLGLERAPIGKSIRSTTSGGTPNCATWSGLKKGKEYDIGNITYYREKTLSITVYD